MAFLGVIGQSTPATAQTVSVAPGSLQPIASIEARYQSYNIEMVEVTGGKFWRPYGPELNAILQQRVAPAASGSDTPAGSSPGLYQYRPPIDLANHRLRELAAALGPAYLRVSGTWANTTYFPETDQVPSAPPAGYGGVLSHAQWRGVIEFATAVDAEIVTSFANGIGTRDPAGVWTPNQARRLLDFTRSIGGRIAAAEFMNEPNLAPMSGAPAGYDAAAYGRDFRIFHDFARQAAPDIRILGPGSVRETAADQGVANGAAPILKTRDMLAASRPARFDAFSYHHYGAVSKRCAAMDDQTTPDAALSEQWLRRTDETLAFYGYLRDEFAPGKPLWLTETADAACGGNPWANTFLDTFRYLDQLGRLARQEVKVVAHNTLTASDYGLLDEKTFEPKPNYWAALLWHRIMGPRVLESGAPVREGLHLYAHCLRGTPGGVALLAINNSRTQPVFLDLAAPADRYTLSAPRLETKDIYLNGRALKLDANDDVPKLEAEAAPSGRIKLAAATITFFAIAAAGNESCR